MTNERFAAFIDATGYVTEAERFGWSPVFRQLLQNGDDIAPAAGPDALMGQGRVRFVVSARRARLNHR